MSEAVRYDQLAPKVDGTSLVTGPVRIAFPNLAQPKIQPGSTEPKYGLAILVPKTPVFTLWHADPACAPYAAVISAAVAKAALPGGRLPPGARFPGADGDEKPHVNGYPGHWIFNVAAKERPQMVGPNNVEYVGTLPFYGGCWVRVQLNAYYTAKFSVIAFGLNIVQFLRDGPRFSTRPDADKVFAPVIGVPVSPAAGPPAAPVVTLEPNDRLPW